MSNHNSNPPSPDPAEHAKLSDGGDSDSSWDIDDDVIISASDKAVEDVGGGNDKDHGRDGADASSNSAPASDEDVSMDDEHWPDSDEEAAKIPLRTIDKVIFYAIRNLAHEIGDKELMEMLTNVYRRTTHEDASKRPNMAALRITDEEIAIVDEFAVANQAKIEQMRPEIDRYEGDDNIKTRREFILQDPVHVLRFRCCALRVFYQTNLLIPINHLHQGRDLQLCKPPAVALEIILQLDHVPTSILDGTEVCRSDLRLSERGQVFPSNRSGYERSVVFYRLCEYKHRTERGYTYYHLRLHLLLFCCGSGRGRRSIDWR
jgi:hypothetical protein